MLLARSESNICYQQNRSLFRLEEAVHLIKYRSVAMISLKRRTLALYLILSTSVTTPLHAACLVTYKKKKEKMQRQCSYHES